MYQQNPQSLSLANLIVLGRIGRGATSHVFQVQSTIDKQLYAMKVFDKKNNKFSSKALKTELNIQQGLKHSNLLQLISHVEDQDNHYVFTDYCEGGQLTNKLKTNLSEPQIANITRQITQGLLYLHQQGIAHCDLKLSNILFRQSTVKICDFGFSRRIKEGPCQKLCGTVFYLSPEIVKENKRSLFKEADVWAFGICLLILLTKKQPYNGEKYKDISCQIIKGERTPLPHLSSELESLMTRLLDPDPKTRITLNQILNHPFLNKHPPLICFNTNKSIYSPHKLNNSQDERNNSELNKEQEEKDEPKWTFKREAKTDSNNHDLTQKKKIRQTSNHDLTIKSKRSKEYLFNETEKEDHNRTVTIKKISLPLLQTRLIAPLTEFSYDTKNEGYVKINSNGDLTIKVKQIVFSITGEGKEIAVGGKSYTLEQINKCKQSLIQPYQLYAYAVKIINIFKNKKYASETYLSFNGQEILLGLWKSKSKWTILSTCQSQRVLIELQQDGSALYRYQGQEWQMVNDETNPQLKTMLQFISSSTLKDKQKQ